MKIIAFSFTPPPRRALVSFSNCVWGWPGVGVSHNSNMYFQTFAGSLRFASLLLRCRLVGVHAASPASAAFGQAERVSQGVAPPQRAAHPQLVAPQAAAQAAPQLKKRACYSFNFSYSHQPGRREPAYFTREQLGLLVVTRHDEAFAEGQMPDVPANKVIKFSTVTADVTEPPV